MNPAEVLSQLMEVIESRRDHPPERSYTETLFRGGVAKIGEKILEEAGEVVEAATELEEVSLEAAIGIDQCHTHRNHVIHEAGDVIYHLFVLLAHQRIDLQDVTSELARRFGTSGLDEKASRSKDKDS